MQRLCPEYHRLGFLRAPGQPLWDAAGARRRQTRNPSDDALRVGKTRRQKAPRCHPALQALPAHKGSLSTKASQSQQLPPLGPELQRLPACLPLPARTCVSQRSQSWRQANAFMCTAAVICLHYQEPVHLISVCWGTIALLSKFYYPRHTVRSSRFSTPPRPRPPRTHNLSLAPGQSRSSAVLGTGG